MRRSSTACTCLKILPITPKGPWESPLPIWISTDFGIPGGGSWKGPWWIKRATCIVISAAKCAKGYFSNEFFSWRYLVRQWLAFPKMPRQVTYLSLVSALGWLQRPFVVSQRQQLRWVLICYLLKESIWDGWIRRLSSEAHFKCCSLAKGEDRCVLGWCEWSKTKLFIYERENLHLR